MALPIRENMLEGASHNILSGNHQFLSKSDNGTVSEGLWGELCDFSGIVNGSVRALELEDGWIVCSKAVSTGMKHWDS